MLCQLPEEKLLNIEALCKELLSKHWGIVELLQGQVDYQQVWQLNVRGFTCQPLGFGRTELYILSRTQDYTVGATTAVQINMIINRVMEATN